MAKWESAPGKQAMPTPSDFPATPVSRIILGMVPRIQTTLFVILLAFVFALLAWILFMGRQYTHLQVAATILVLTVVLRFVKIPRLSSLNEKLAATLSRIPSLPGPIVAGVVMAAAFALRMWWSLHFDVEPASDYARFYEYAIKLSKGDLSALSLTKSPTTVLVYGAAFKLAGSSLVTVYTLNAALSALQVLLVYAIARRVFASAAAAGLAAIIVAIYPSTIAYYSLPNSEAMFFTLLLLMVWQLLRFAAKPSERRGAVARLALIVGVETAALHLTRNSGVVFGVWMVMAALLWVRAPVRLRLVFAGAFIAAASVCLLPQVVDNYRTLGYFSIQSSRYGALNLLSGTNIPAGGKHNRRDVGYIRQKGGIHDETWAEMARDLRRMAKERVMKDPVFFLRFGLTTKFRTMWCSEEYGVMLSMIKTSHDMKQLAPFRKTWLSRADRFYFLVILLAVAGMGRVFFGNREYRLFVVMMGGLLLVTFLAHILIEVQPRYHLILNFVLPFLAGPLLSPRQSPRPAVGHDPVTR